MEAIMDSAQLTKEKMVLEQEIIDTETQLHKVKSKARTTGEYADVEWFNETVHSVNQKKLQVKQLNITISEMKNAAQKSNIVASITNGGFKGKFDLVQVGVYLEPRIARKLDNLGKQIGRGAKSSIVNEALKQFFASNK